MEHTPELDKDYLHLTTGSRRGEIHFEVSNFVQSPQARHGTVARKHLVMINRLKTNPHSPDGKGELAVVSSVELDPEKAAQRKSARIEHLNTVTIPALRFVGFAGLSLAIYGYLRFFEHRADAAQVAFKYAGVALVYCLAVALFLRKFYRPLPGAKLAVAFLALDMVLQTVAVYVTGGEKSWLVALLLLRVADQATTGQRRALLFAHWGVLCFLGLTAYLDFAEGRPIDWPRELTKAGLLYGAGMWIAVSARTADRRRRQVSEAINAARGMILELETLARRLREARIHAEAANLAKGQFLANVSHELRTPLVAVIGIADLLSQEDLTADHHELVVLLQTSANSLLRLVDDVLDFSKIETGKLEINAQPCRLEDVVADAVLLLRPKASDKKVELRHSVQGDLPPAITDPARLRQVLLNLLGNAVKFTPRGWVEVRVAALEGEARNRVRFEVEDTGIGITEEQKHNLFEPFTQADASSTRSYGGTGLGLSLSKRLVDLLGGSIGVESRPGEGATFWFEIPLHTE